MSFALTNTERLCLGLAPIEHHWSALPLEDATVYLDGDVLRKLVRGRDDTGPGHLEADGAIRTCDQGTRFAPARKGTQGALLTLAMKNFIALILVELGLVFAFSFLVNKVSAVAATGMFYTYAVVSGA